MGTTPGSSRKKKGEIEKETYRLWLEYLRRSKPYEDFCKSLLPENNPKFSMVMGKLSSANLSKEGLVYLQWGNIWNASFSFDAWYEDYKESDRRERFAELINDYANHAAEDLEGCIRLFILEHDREPSIWELRDTFARHLEYEHNSHPSGRTVLIAYTAYGGQDELTKAFDAMMRVNARRPRIKAAVKAARALHTKAGAHVHLDEFRRYLDRYDLSQQKGMTIRKMIELREPDKLRESKNAPLIDSVKRAYFRDIRQAKSTIRNVEEGFFPGESK